jgi:HAD superfamily hydrolase (TIGR01509 family)
MINAVIFDLDGVIIDSEPLWKEAEKKIFKTVGIDLTNEMCRQTTGLDCIDTVNYWYEYQPWKGRKAGDVRDDIYEELLRLIEQKGELKEDVERIIDLFKDRKIPMAVASSSPLEIINMVLQTFRLGRRFAVVHSSELERSGKPHPAVYLSTARMLKKEPLECLAFEDSYYGALSAHNAGMKVVAIPDNDEYEDSKFDFADLKIRSFKEFGEYQLNYLDSLI